MTLTMIDHDDEPFAQFGLDSLSQSIQERISVNISHFFPPVALSSDWYTQPLLDALSATRALLVGKQKMLHVEDRVKPLADITREEETLNIGRSDITVDNQAVVSLKMPVYEEDQQVTTLVAQLDQLVSFLERGAAQGALLRNFDYEEKAVEPALIAESSEPTVEEGIPEEALASEAS